MQEQRQGLAAAAGGEKLQALADTLVGEVDLLSRAQHSHFSSTIAKYRKGPPLHHELDLE